MKATKEPPSQLRFSYLTQTTQHVSALKGNHQVAIIFKNIFIQGLAGETGEKETSGETQAQMGIYQAGYPGGMWVYGLDWAGPGQGQVADTCECGNEPSGSVKCGEFLDWLQTSQLLKKDSAPWSKSILRKLYVTKEFTVKNEISFFYTGRMYFKKLLSYQCKFMPKYMAVH